jgi:hypothetical protein
VREDRDLLRGIQAEIVAQGIQAEADVFSPFGVGGAAPAPGASFSLTHRPSGLPVELGPAPGSNGLPDPYGLLPALEKCYRRMLMLDPDQEVFSASQRQAIRRLGQGRLLAWALEAGAWTPPVELDTGGASWRGDALELRVKVGGLSGQAETERKLLVPVDDAGRPDLANLPELAQETARGWAGGGELAQQHKLHDSIVEILEPQVREYVEVLLELRAEFQKAFWQAMNQEIEKDRQRVAKLERDLEEVERKFKTAPEKLVVIEENLRETTGSRALRELRATPSKVATGLWDALGIIAGELMKLPGKVYEGIAPHADDMAKGVEFGFKAAGIVVGETALFMLKQYARRAVDMAIAATVGSAAGNAVKVLGSGKAVRFAEGTAACAELLTGRAMVAHGVYQPPKDVVDLAIDVDSRIRKLRDKLYKNKS